MINKYKFYYRFFVILFWVTMCSHFVIEEFTPLSAIFRRNLDMLLVFAFIVLGFMLMRTKREWCIFGAFMVISLTSTFLMNHLSPMIYLNGFRNYAGLLFSVPILYFFLSGPNALEFKAKFDRQLQIWLYIQAFCVMWQFFRYGANDAGGGSMGYGASGMVSMLIYLVSYYLVIQNWDFLDYLGSLKRNAGNVLLLFPTFFNETKISFILFLLYFLLLYKPTRTLLLKLVYIIPFSIAIGAGLIYTYIVATGVDPELVLASNYVTDYLFGSDMDEVIEVAQMLQDGDFDDTMYEDNQYWVVDIQRFAKIPLTAPELKKSGGGMAFGAGLSTFNGGSVAGMSEFARRNRWMLVGTRPMFYTVWVELGVVGLIWFFVTVGIFLYSGIKKNPSPQTKRMTTFISICVFLMLLYNEALIYFYFTLLFFYLNLAIRLYSPKKSLQEEVSRIPVKS